MRYTDEHLEFLRDGYQRMTVVELTSAFNARYGSHQSRPAIGTTIKREKITRARRILPGRYRAFCRERAEFLRDSYRALPLSDLVNAFNARFGTDTPMSKIRGFVHNNGIKSGRTGRFEKGQAVWNKGVKGYMGANRTSFRKGHTPKNLTPLGTERINKDGYIELKVAERNPYTGFPTRYRLKHQVIWEAAHGPVPSGKVVIFTDGDRSKCVIENLSCITRSELARLNQFGYSALEAELKPTMMMLAKLKVKTFDRLRNQPQGVKV